MKKVCLYEHAAAAASKRAGPTGLAGNHAVRLRQPIRPGCRIGPSR